MVTPPPPQDLSLDPTLICGYTYVLLQGPESIFQFACGVFTWLYVSMFQTTRFWCASLHYSTDFHVWHIADIFRSGSTAPEHSKSSETGDREGADRDMPRAQASPASPRIISSSDSDESEFEEGRPPNHTVNVVKNQAGRDMVAIEGHGYAKNRTSKDGNTTYWECQYRRRGPCMGRATIVNGVPKLSGNHNHPAEPTLVSERVFAQGVREMASNSSLTPRSIMATAYRPHKPAVRSALPEPRQVAQNIKRMRSGLGEAGREPGNAAELTVPEVFSASMYEPSNGRFPASVDIRQQIGGKRR